MAIALVGSTGSLTNATSGTLSPSFGQATTAHNLLVAVVASIKTTGTTNTIDTPSGWTLAVSDTSKAEASVAVFYKADCAAGETAPTWTVASGRTMYARLQEYSGADKIDPLDQTSTAAVTSSGTSMTLTPTMASADLVSGDLVCSMLALWAASGRTVSTSHSFNNGATVVNGSNNDGTSTQTHQRIAFGITTGNSTADSDTISVSSIASGDIGVAAFVSFNTPYASDSGSGTITLSGSSSESASASDSQSGTVTLGGSSSESASFADAKSGSVTLSGSSTESASFADTASGSVTFSGSTVESFSGSDSGSGTFTLSGSWTESFVASDSSSGTFTLGGSGVESFGYVDSSFGTITVSGSRLERYVPAGEFTLSSATSSVVALAPSWADSFVLSPSDSGSLVISPTE